MANYIAKGRQVVVPLTNKSGNAVEYGDVVILDTGTAESFDVTTTEGYSAGFIGVVVDQDGIANDVIGRICIEGYVAQVNLDGAAAIGDYLFTDTVAEQGTPAAARAEGAFGQALEANATPSAYIWGNPDGAGGGGGAPTDVDYWVETADGGLSAEVVVGTTGITTATYATRQAAAKAGRLFLPSDGSYIERDTGAAWAPWGPVYPFTRPVLGDFSWVNQGASTAATTYGGIMMIKTEAQNRLLVKSAPAAPYVITAAFHMLMYGTDCGGGLYFRQSSDGKLSWNVFKHSGGADQITSEKWNGVNSYSASYGGFTRRSCWWSVLWLRIADNNTNRICSVSVDGQNWYDYHTVGRTDFITADEVGFGMWNGAAETQHLHLLSWKET